MGSIICSKVGEMTRMAVCIRSVGYREFIELEIQTWEEETYLLPSLGELNSTKLGAVTFKEILAE